MLMASTIKVTTIGNSTGIILPKEVLSRLKIERGDNLFLVETPNGIELSPYDKDFADEMASAKRVMKKYRDVLRKLAE
jgi:putative addiction module antidote